MFFQLLYRRAQRDPSSPYLMTMMGQIFIRLNVKFQTNSSKVQDARDFFSSQFEAQPKSNIACEIDKIYLLT